MLTFRTFTGDFTADRIIGQFINGRILTLTEKEIDAYIDLAGPGLLGKSRNSVIGGLLFDEAFGAYLAESGLFPEGYPAAACAEAFVNFRLILFDEDVCETNMLMNYLMFHLIDRWKLVYEYQKINVETIPDPDDRVLGACLQIAKKEAKEKFVTPTPAQIVNLARGYVLYFEDLCNYGDLCFKNHDFTILDQVNLDAVAGAFDAAKEKMCEKEDDQEKAEDGKRTNKWYS